MSARRWLARVVAFVRSAHHDRDFAAELETHLRLLVEDYLRSGMSRADAERAARIRLGSAAALAANHRDARGLPSLESLWQDVRFALRLTWKERWFSAAAVLTLGVGIGANAVGFSIVNAAFLRGIPFPEASRLVKVGWLTSAGRVATLSLPEFEEFRGAAAGIELAAFHEMSVNISDDDSAPERIRGMWATANTFRVLRQPPLVGRDFTPEDERTGSPRVVIISHALWTTRYGGQADILGRMLRVDGQPAVIVGVMPPGMHFEDNARLWAPLVTDAAAPRRDDRRYRVFGRLQDGAARARILAPLNTLAERLKREYPDSTRNYAGAAVQPYEVAGFARTMFATVMVSVGLVLLVACLNVANLLLSRSVFRAREVALRVALGATRARVLRQLLIESLVLAVAGGALGLLLAIGGVAAFEAAMQASEKPYWLVFTVDRAVAGYVVAVCLLTALLFGLAPALHVSRTNANEVLKEGGRSSANGPRARWFSDSIVVAQLALTVVLVAGAGFLLRSFVTLHAVDLGIDTTRLLAANVVLTEGKYATPAARWAFLERLQARVSALPGVESTAWTTRVPPAAGDERLVEIEEPGSTTVPSFASTVAVSDEFFTVLGRRLVKGHEFQKTQQDSGDADTAIVNERFAALLFADGDPIGRRFRFTTRNPPPGRQPDPWRTIIGVSAGVRQGELEDAYASPVIYLPYRREAPAAATLLMRSPLQAETLVAAIRREARAEDPDQPVLAVQSVAQMLERDRWPYRVFGGMFSILAASALVLSGIGLYALMAYAVSRRTHEIGVRIAVGAARSHVSWLVLRRGLVQLALGGTLGLAGAWMLGAVLEGMLVDMSAFDPLTFAIVLSVMSAVTVAACVVPTSRAVRVDPVAALRAD